MARQLVPCQLRRPERLFQGEVSQGGHGQAARVGHEVQGGDRGEDLFASYSGLPVVDANGVLLGVISRKDLAKGGSVVRDVMNSQPIAAKRTAKVQDAAVLMLKHKVHRIPVVDDRARCIGTCVDLMMCVSSFTTLLRPGIVTRFDIFTAMADGL